MPDKADCAAALADQADGVTNELVVDSYVCGHTHEGRAFRIHVTAAGDSEIVGTVTVWKT